MPNPNIQELIEKVKDFGAMLRDASAHLKELGVQREAAIKEAVRLASLHTKDFGKKEKDHLKDKGHDL